MLKKIVKTIDTISSVGGWCGAPLPFLAALFTVYEIVMRTIFERPTVWAAELTAMMCGACYFLGGAWNIREDAHVKVDIIHALFKPRGRAILDIVNFFFQALYIAIMIRVIWPYMINAFALSERPYTVWNPYLWPMKTIMFAGFVLVMLQAAAQFIRNLHLVIKGKAL